MKNLRKSVLFIVIILIFNICNVYAKEDLKVDAKAVLLMEEESGEIVYEKNVDESYPPASITKLMTYLIAMEDITKGRLGLDDLVVISKKASNERGATYYLRENETMKLRDLIEAMMIVSSNDAAMAIAEYVGEDEEKFVASMNQKAKEIGMTNTHFENPNGMPEEGKGNRMSARDIATLARYLLKNYKMEMLPLTNTEKFINTKRRFEKETTNHLLKMIPEVDGLKTGYTDEAGYCLASTMSVAGQDTNFRLISVVLGTESDGMRVRESKKVLEYGKNNYVKEKILDQDEMIDEMNLFKINDLPINLLPKKDLYIFGPKEGIVKKKEISLLKKRTLRVKKGEKLGSVAITLYNDEVVHMDLVSDRDINDVSVGVFIRNYKFIFAGVLSSLW
ncbi:D-alanyl-D-alanine carboxypeptidase [Lutibacter sp. B2]|nr:D-alanyl-D-alanine carboxypeptidase [Lutibacter sp. B2]